MAVRSFTEENDKLDGAILVTWTGLLNGDTGSPYKALSYVEKTVQVTGTFGTGGSVAFQGTNDPSDSPGSFGVLHRADGTAGDMNLTDVEPATPLEAPIWVRPEVTAGDGATSLTCRMLYRRKR